MKLMLAALLTIAHLNAQGQTNLAKFQGYFPGATVRVNCRKPLIILRQATLFDISASNIVVTTSSDRFVLGKDVTILSEPTARDGASVQAIAITDSKTSPKPVTASGQNGNKLSSDVQRMVLEKYAKDPGYEKARSEYQTTMSAFEEGKVSLGDIAARAESVLGEVDKFMPEREKNPEFEGQISMLRDFVERAKAGEQVSVEPIE